VTGKARSPMVEKLVHRTTSDNEEKKSTVDPLDKYWDCTARSAQLGYIKP